MGIRARPLPERIRLHRGHRHRSGRHLGGGKGRAERRDRSSDKLGLDGRCTDPVGTDTTWFNAVSASSANDVWAVGLAAPSGGGTNPLAEHWDGTAWTASPPLAEGFVLL